MKLENLFSPPKRWLWYFAFCWALECREEMVRLAFPGLGAVRGHPCGDPQCPAVRDPREGDTAQEARLCSSSPVGLGLQGCVPAELSSPARLWPERALTARRRTLGSQGCVLALKVHCPVILLQDSWCAEVNGQRFDGHFYMFLGSMCR